jgi:Tfp pilus assembly protein PilE
VEEATGNTFVEQLSALVVVAAIAQKPHSPSATTTEKNSKPKPKPDMYGSSKIQKPKRPLLQQQMRKQIKFKTRHVWQQNPETSKTHSLLQQHSQKYQNQKQDMNRSNIQKPPKTHSRNLKNPFAFSKHHMRFL